MSTNKQHWQTLANKTIAIRNSCTINLSVGFKQLEAAENYYKLCIKYLSSNYEVSQYNDYLASYYKLGSNLYKLFRSSYTHKINSIILERTNVKETTT